MSIIVQFKNQRWYVSPKKKKEPQSNLSKKRKNFRRRKWKCAFLHWPTLTRRININKSVKW